MIHARYNIPIRLSLDIQEIHQMDKQTAAALYLNEFQETMMDVSAFQLAILSKQLSVITCMLQLLAPPNRKGDLNNHEVLQILGNKTVVKFSDKTSATLYTEEDSMLDGRNSFHLAVRFFPQCLGILIEFLEKHRLHTEMQELLERKDQQIQKTPLHMASIYQNTFALR